MGNHGLLVVSNRLPVTLAKGDGGWSIKLSSGGLTSAMRRLLERRKGSWIGWYGHSSDQNDAQLSGLLEQLRQEERYIGVDLSGELVTGFYEGFSNESLWPLFHQFPLHLRFRSSYWNAYKAVNQLFADCIMRHWQPGDVVWVHDYQLMLLPAMLRKACPDMPIGFFLHIPFPSSNVFRILPRGDEILEGVLGADYVGFHTHIHAHNFRSSILRTLGLACDIDTVDLGARKVRIEALPLGIDPDAYSKPLMDDEGTKSQLARLRPRFAGQKLLLAVDRLDYTKGIPQRLRAFDRFLELHPEFRGKVVLIQVAVPSREKISAFQELRQETDQLVGEISGKWATAQWVPLIYIKRSLHESELLALYAAADVAIVTPLDDGMNLVAKEYLAAKRGKGGALVLSEFAGAAQELPEAFRVNPYDEDETSAAIFEALTASESEKARRLTSLFGRVQQYTVFDWGEKFLSKVLLSAAERQKRGIKRGQELDCAALTEKYLAARRRLIMLDYDGTLVGYVKDPSRAAPSNRLKRLLRILASERKNTALVISGRTSRDLEQWLCDIEQLWLAAEHGTVLKEPNGIWKQLRKASLGKWRTKVLDVLREFVERTPGSHIEEKDMSLVWHYRGADPEFGAWMANQMLLTVRGALADSELSVVMGQKTVEIKFAWALKSQILKVFHPADFDFILAAGDDSTDEDLFSALPPRAWTIKVGYAETSARFHLATPSDVLDLLEGIAATGDGERPLEEIRI